MSALPICSLGVGEVQPLTVGAEGQDARDAVAGGDTIGVVVDRL